MEKLGSEHRIRHNLSVAYSPWANGTAESLMRSVLSACRAMLADLKIGPEDWASVIPAIAFALSEASMDRLGRSPDGLARSPFEVMTGIVFKRPLLRVLTADVDHASVKTIDCASALLIIRIEQLQKTLDEIHKDVQPCRESSPRARHRRAQQGYQHNRSVLRRRLLRPCLPRNRPWTQTPVPMVRSVPYHERPWSTSVRDNASPWRKHRTSPLRSVAEVPRLSPRETDSARYVPPCRTDRYEVIDKIVGSARTKTDYSSKSSEKAYLTSGTTPDSLQWTLR